MKIRICSKPKSRKRTVQYIRGCCFAKVKSSSKFSLGAMRKLNFWLETTVFPQINRMWSIFFRSTYYACTIRGRGLFH